MATTPTRLSLDEFHRLYDGVKPYYEYWFGEAIQKSMPTKLHSALQIVLALLLTARGWNPFSELRLKLTADAEPVPDLTATRRKETREPYQTTPPDLCIEILSPQDRLKKTIEKGKHYLNWGVTTVWIIDPQNRTARVMTPAHPDGIEIPQDIDLTAGDTVISMAEVFAEVDRKLA